MFLVNQDGAYFVTHYKGGVLVRAENSDSLRNALFRVFGEQLGHERMARNLAVSNGATFPYRIALTNSEWANYYGKAVRAMKYEDVIQHVRETHRDALDVERKIKAHLKIARAIKQGWEEPNG